LRQWQLWRTEICAAIIRKFSRISEKSAASAKHLKNPRYRIVLVAHLLQIAFSPALSSSSINASSFDLNNYTAEGLPRREWATKMIEIGLQPSSAIDRLRAALAVARRFTSEGTAQSTAAHSD
jgi:hypothetical protein